MNILLFGGAGYIGTHTALAFLERGDRVGIFDNLSSGLESNISSEADFYKGDILDPDRVNEVLSEGWDAVIHLAACKAAGESMLKPEKYSINNICGSLNIITGCAANNISRFVLSSSAAVYGEPQYLPIDEEHPLQPENYYGYTKLAIERHLEWYHKLKGLKYVSLRYFNAAGYDPDGKMTGLERNPANLLPVIMETAAGWRDSLSIFGNDYPTDDGTGVRDYIHVTDLADAHVRAVDYLSQAPNQGHFELQDHSNLHDRSPLQDHSRLIVNLGSETGLSVFQILDTARKITKQPIPAVITDRRPGDPAELVASAAFAKETLDWSPRFSDAETLVTTTWEVYKRYLQRQ